MYLALLSFLVLLGVHGAAGNLKDEKNALKHVKDLLPNVESVLSSSSSPYSFTILKREVNKMLNREASSWTPADLKTLLFTFNYDLHQILKHPNVDENTVNLLAQVLTWLSHVQDLMNPSKMVDTSMADLYHNKYPSPKDKLRAIIDAARRLEIRLEFGK